MLSTALFGRPAFKNVIVNGLILAADGKKMSKRLKNYPDPDDVIENFGADALRAYLINSAVVRAEPMRFGKDANDTSGEAVKETVRLVVLPLFNAYNFLATYALADGWSPTQADLEVHPSGDLDRWILSRVQHFLKEMQQEYENYELEQPGARLHPALGRAQQLVHPPRPPSLLAQGRREQRGRQRQARGLRDAVPRARHRGARDGARDAVLHASTSTSA